MAIYIYMTVMVETSIMLQLLMYMCWSEKYARIVYVVVIIYFYIAKYIYFCLLNWKVDKHNRQELKHNRLKWKHNSRNVLELLKSIIGKILSIMWTSLVFMSAFLFAVAFLLPPSPPTNSFIVYISLPQTNSAILYCDIIIGNCVSAFPLISSIINQ